MNRAMREELTSALVEAEGCRCLLIRGEGRAFCAGRDLGDWHPDEDATAIIRQDLNPLLRRLYELPLPTIAAVQGACMGSGFGLAFACDIVLVADDAQISSPFARLGAILDSGGHFVLARTLGRHRTLDLVYTGRRLSGRDAERYGLVSRSVAGSELLTVARELARTLAAGPTAAFAISKRITLAAMEASYADILDAEAVGQGEASRSADYREGMQAFQEKRTPVFTGR